MKPLKLILAATDLSAPARHAVTRAFRLAASGGSELHILCALELDALDVSLREMLVGDSSTVKSALVDDAREHLARLAGDPAIQQYRWTWDGKSRSNSGSDPLTTTHFNWSLRQSCKRISDA